MCHCREGATIVPYESCLWKGGSAEESVLLRPQSRTPQEHAKQAYEILSKLCGVPQGKKVTASDLVPDLSLFLGDACKRMINGAIHGVDLELFALAVEFMFHEEKDDMVRTESGIRGCKWMPLSVIAFAGSFVSAFVFLPRLYCLYLTLFSVIDGTPTSRREGVCIWG